MGHQLSMRKKTVMALTVLALVLSGFITAASAAAATQHWAGTSQPTAPIVPKGSQQGFSAELVMNPVIGWTPGGAGVTLECTALSASGNAENPTAGGAGVISSSGLSLSGCIVKGQTASCEIENGSIPLSPLSTAAVESGSDVIKTSGAQTQMRIKARSGQSCTTAGLYPVEGRTVLRQSPSGPGYYEFSATGNELRIGGTKATITGSMYLKTTSGQLLTESSVSTPGLPHWFVGSSKWTPFAAGSSVNYVTGGSASVAFKNFVAGGTSGEIVCSAAGNGLAGSLENPIGGGAGTTNAQLSLAGCVLIAKGTAGCSPPVISTNPLTGQAEEVTGATRVKYSPVEGETLMTISIQKAEGTSELCNMKGTYPVKGKMVASAVGDGHFELSGLEMKINSLTANMTGSLLLETAAGEALRLQP